MLIILALFIPTYIAIYLYMSATETPVKTSSVYAMDLKGPDGSNYYFSVKDSEEKKFIDFFLDMNDTAKNVQSLPEDLKDTPHYTVTYYSYDLETDYKYYFSKTKPSSSYIVDHMGKVSRINATSTIEFLDSKYSAPLYFEASTPAELMVKDSVVKPSRLEWHYYTYSAVKQQSDIPAGGKESNLNMSFSDIPISFTVIPTEAFIEIKDASSKVLFSGTLEEYNSTTPIENIVRQDMALTVNIKAEWEDSISKGFGGSAEYSFVIDCIYDPMPKFWLGETAVESGELVVISGLHIEDIDGIVFSCDPYIGFEPVFYRDGEYVRALIPIDYDLNLAGKNIVFTLTYDEETTKLTLTVKRSTLPSETRKYNYNNKVNTSARTDAKLEKFKEFVTSVESSSTAYFNSYFLFDDLGNNRAIFGDIINNGKEADKFTSKGLAFVAYQNSIIHAVNDGVVVSVGNTDYGGLTVVVDHGLGLRSVYYCMSKASVSVGDTVKRGDEIGKGAASKGYSDGVTAYIELWVEDIPISYIPLLKSGRTSMIVYGDR